MPVHKNKRAEQGHGDNDDRGERYRPPRHSSLKSELSPTGYPGKWQYRLERPEGEEEQNADVPVAQLEIHPEPVSIHAANTLARSVDRGPHSRFAREPAHNF